ncbi:unnamed protein product [Leuciscus chuanchicus]
MLPWQLPAHEDKGYTSSRARRRSEAMRADTQTPARQLRVCQSTSQNEDFHTVARERFNDAFTNVVQKRLNIQSRYKYAGLHTEQLNRHSVVKGEHLLTDLSVHLPSGLMMTAHEMSSATGVWRSGQTLASQPDLEPAASTQILPETLKETRQISTSVKPTRLIWQISIRNSAICLGVCGENEVGFGGVMYDQSDGQRLATDTRPAHFTIYPKYKRKTSVSSIYPSPSVCHPAVPMQHQLQTPLMDLDRTISESCCGRTHTPDWKHLASDVFPSIVDHISQWPNRCSSMFRDALLQSEMMICSDSEMLFCVQRCSSAFRDDDLCSDSEMLFCVQR